MLTSEVHFIFNIKYFGQSMNSLFGYSVFCLNDSVKLCSAVKKSLSDALSVICLPSADVAYVIYSLNAQYSRGVGRFEASAVRIDKILCIGCRNKRNTVVILACGTQIVDLYFLTVFKDIRIARGEALIS